MTGAYLFALALNKTAAPAYFINYRFVKELIKFFFTLLLKKRFVDIVKCVKNYKLLFLLKY
jgi:hypothetical protein